MTDLLAIANNYLLNKTGSNSRRESTLKVYYNSFEEIPTKLSVLRESPYDEIVSIKINPTHLLIILK